jgi:hypothetical protein
VSRAALLSAALLVILGGACHPHLRGQGGGEGDDAGTVDASSPVEMGRLAVAQRNCGSCHQSPDPSDGVLSGQTTPLPGAPSTYGSNLTPDPDTGLDGWSATDIAAALTQGIDAQGDPLCPSMPAYCDMGMDEALAIAAYLQSLPAVWHPIPASECPPYEPLPDSGVPAVRQVCDDAGADGDGE